MNHKLGIFLLMGLLLLSSGLEAETVIEDDGVGMSREELEKIVERWTPGMRSSAANDLGDRLELLNIAMTNKKMAHKAENLSPDNDPEAYWRYYFDLQRMQRKFVFDRFLSTLETPDMSALAQELYKTSKDKYAKVAAQRTSSHILFMCPPGCNRVPLKPQVEEVLQQLRAGASFEEMVLIHSQDPGSKAKEGKFGRWISPGQVDVSAPYVGALFDIEEAGGYSDIVETQFGLHIIRLDEARESYYRPFDEVREAIVQDLVAEYGELAAKEFQASFRLSDEVQIDGEVVEQIFSQYKTVQDEPGKK
jgi:peptidyl-prolyl cis-trans isomerase C